jgi:hypothetical protein
MDDAVEEVDTVAALGLASGRESQPENVSAVSITTATAPVHPREERKDNVTDIRSPANPIPN